MDSRSDLPKVHYATALDWFIICSFLYCIASILEFAGVHYFTKVNFLWICSEHLKKILAFRLAVENHSEMMGLNLISLLKMKMMRSGKTLKIGR